jgi:hypothetical protein
MTAASWHPLPGSGTLPCPAQEFQNPECSQTTAPFVSGMQGSYGNSNTVVQTHTVPPELLAPPVLQSKAVPGTGASGQLTTMGGPTIPGIAAEHGSPYPHTNNWQQPSSGNSAQCQAQHVQHPAAPQESGHGQDQGIAPVTVTVAVPTAHHSKASQQLMALTAQPPQSSAHALVQDVTTVAVSDPPVKSTCAPTGQSTTQLQSQPKPSEPVVEQGDHDSSKQQATKVRVEPVTLQTGSRRVLPASLRAPPASGTGKRPPPGTARGHTDKAPAAPVQPAHPSTASAAAADGPVLPELSFQGRTR